MNRALSISSLILILFLMIFHCVQSANDIVQDTCKKMATDVPDLNFDFCVKSLGSESESHEADLEGLGLIGLKLLKANLTGTIEYIKQLMKQKPEPHLLEGLSLCLDVYDSLELKDLIPYYKAKRYDDVRSWVSSMMTSEDTCDTQESSKRGMVPPLTKRNVDIFQLTAIGLGILAILLGRV
ncbi:putative invertase inhibitor [Syzygium oleosum]|uniref:putative invertase inhibitor n=1 Tax=Syzygium oleosum TaxID=219896 RepID=UPI0024BBBD36|nr:putative invertase inhibitor [Syzygium oleosum]